MKITEALALPAVGCIFAFLSLASVAGSLQCFCKDVSCEARGTDTCEGDICYAQAVIDISGTLTIWRCYPMRDIHLCNTSSVFHTTICCEHEDFCNENLSPTIPPGSPTNPPPSETEPPPSTEPPPPTKEPECATEFTVPFGNPIESKSCFRSSSKRADIKLCSFSSSCYTTIRRTSNGSLSYSRGCSVETCVPENRNRKLKLCCSSSLCNDQVPALDEVSIPYTGDLLSLLGNITDNAAEEDSPKTRCGGKTTLVSTALPITQSSSIPIIKTSSVVSVTVSTSYLVAPENPLPESGQPESKDESLFYILIAVVLVMFAIIQIPLIYMFVHICKHRHKIKKGKSVSSASELPIHT